MKLKHLLERVEKFLDAEERERRGQRERMKKVLHDLKRKERKLRAAVEAESDTTEREALEGRLLVVHAQRRKGVAALKALKKKS